MFSPTCSNPPRNPILTGTSPGAIANVEETSGFGGRAPVCAGRGADHGRDVPPHCVGRGAVSGGLLACVLSVRPRFVLAGLFTCASFDGKSIETFVVIEDSSMFCFMNNNINMFTV
jgi:hypothetical protein